MPLFLQSKVLLRWICRERTIPWYARVLCIIAFVAYFGNEAAVTCRQMQDARIFRVDLE